MKIGNYDLDVKQLHVSRVAHRESTAPRPSDIAEQQLPDMSELGISQRNAGVYDSFDRHEYLPELRGQRGLALYDKMKRSDAQVRSSLLLIKAPVLSAQWYMEPFSSEPEDIEVSEFVSWSLNSLHRPFMSFLREAMYFLDYGHYAFEKVFEVAEWRPERKGSHARTVIKWQDFAPRHPFTMREVEYDIYGHPVAWWQERAGRVADRKKLPWDKLLTFAWDQEADDPHGVSVLRSAYMHWYYKQNLYKVDAIQKERHGIGIPDIELPPGYSKDDKAIAREMGRNLRTNERAFVVRPPGMHVGFIKPEGNLVDALASAEHHNREIAKNVLAQFMADTSGSNARDSSHIDLFTKALRYLADIVRGQINQFAIPELVDFNFSVRGYPQLKVRRISESAEFRSLAVAARNLVEPGILTPTPELEAFISEVGDFPQPNSEAMERTIEDRITKGVGYEPVEDPDAATNENRDDPGNQATGKSPRGNPTE